MGIPKKQMACFKVQQVYLKREKYLETTDVKKYLKKKWLRKSRYQGWLFVIKDIKLPDELSL